MFIRNLPFSLDAHAESPFDPSADLCEIEVLRNTAYLRELKAPENAFRARIHKPPEPVIEYFFTLTHGLESIVQATSEGKEKKTIPLTRELAERAYQLIEILADSLANSQKRTPDRSEDELQQLLIGVGYVWENDLIVKSIDYNEKKMLNALCRLSNGKEEYFTRQQFPHSSPSQQELPTLEGYYREDRPDGSALYRTHEKVFGRYLLTDIMVTPVLLDSKHKGWHLQAFTVLEERRLPLAKIEEYCLHAEDLEKEICVLVKKLSSTSHKYLQRGDIWARPERKLG